jgi:hypothetical protein
LEDPSTLSTLISLLGKAKDSRKQREDTLALLSLQAHVRVKKRALIGLAVAEYEKRIKKAWQPSSGRLANRPPFFTLDTYRHVSGEVVEEARSRSIGEHCRDFGRAGTAARK